MVDLGTGPYGARGTGSPGSGSVEILWRRTNLRGLHSLMSRRALFILLQVVACDQGTPLQPVPPPHVPPPPPTNRPPTAVVSVLQHGGWEGVFPFRFSAAGSSDPDGDSLSYKWDWGDGTTVTGTTVQQDHTYRDNGTYTVQLTVADRRGAAASDSLRVTVWNRAPFITSVTLATPPQPSPVPMLATVHVQFQDDGAADTHVLTVDWGDGTSSRNETTHIYDQPGVYMAEVTVTDNDGASTSRQVGSVWVYDPGQAVPIAGYEVVDLGTLGGADAMPYALNNLGEVVGVSATTDSQRQAFLWRGGAMININVASHEYGSAATINDAGWIAGGSMRDHRIPVWKDGVFRSFLPILGGEGGAWPVKIIESGDVLLNNVGHEKPSAYLARNGLAINLGGLSPGYISASFTTDMNTHGQVVGRSVYQRPAGTPEDEYRAFVWANGVMTELRNLATAPCHYNREQQCGASEALDISESGEIVGYASNGSISRAVRWDAGDRMPHDLGFGTGASRAVAINERGQIAGDGSDEGLGYFRENDAVVTLGSLGGGETRVVAMNEDGTVIGTSMTASGEVRAFVWRREIGMRDLGGGPFSGPRVRTSAVAINERGDIVGYAAPCPYTKSQGTCPDAGPRRAILWRAAN